MEQIKQGNFDPTQLLMQAQKEQDEQLNTSAEQTSSEEKAPITSTEESHTSGVLKSAQEDKEMQNPISVDRPAIKAESGLTPLQQLIKERQQRGRGIAYTKEEVAAANDHSLRKEEDNDQRRKEYSDKIDDLDNLIRVAPELSVVGVTNDQDMVETIEEIEEYANTGSIPENAKHIKLRKRHNADDNHDAPEYDEDQTDADYENFKERSRIAEILIDKTGLGADVHFTEEERQKLSKVTQLRVKEVKDITLSVTEVAASQKSFLETISEHQISSCTTTVMLPASGISVTVKGLSFGELGDIALSNENMTFAKLNKKLTVIYNNIVNTSIGKFKSYEDFLKSIAYTDIPFLVYGIVCSTMPEEDTIVLTCNKKECGNQFEIAYAPRSLPQFKKMSKTILRGFEAITKAANPTEARKVADESFFKKVKKIELPESKYYVEIGVASCYEYLHGTMNEILEDKFVKEHPDDVNGTLAINTLFISMIRAISVPVDGKYTRYDNPMDIVDILYTVKPGDTPILSQIVSAYINALDAKFAIKDEIVCPHCGTISREVPIDIDSLVFMKYQMLNNTEIDLSEMLDL